MKFAVVLVGFACLVPGVHGQDKQLDFWIGDWVVKDTTPYAKNPPGTNSIRKIYGGKVVLENFKMGSFEGQSWSVFDPKAKIWRQTWVDNNGAYIAMTSKLVKSKLAIQTVPNPASQMTASRMVFSNVKPDSFTWSWEATKNGGKSWSLSWRLQYTRKKS